MVMNPATIEFNFTEIEVIKKYHFSITQYKQLIKKHIPKIKTFKSIIILIYFKNNAFHR